MGFNIFLDANVILDQTLKRKEYDSTRQVFQLILSGQISAFTSPSIIHIVGYWLAKAYGANEARQILLTLLNDVYLLELGHDITIKALHSKILDVEDALQYHTAIHHDMDYFISSDKKIKTMEASLLPVLTPLELLNRFK
jgi:predicted nucleic acid-binding protein